MAELYQAQDDVQAGAQIFQRIRLRIPLMRNGRKMVNDALAMPFLFVRSLHSRRDAANHRVEIIRALFEGRIAKVLDPRGRGLFW